ncbi:MAG: thioredoxin domain-containing protein [Candidatus Pacebacteria bacterium]|nr:thioredoxin domain-containing protein [Candidatus Paceibacterota bacterium]
MKHAYDRAVYATLALVGLLVLGLVVGAYSQTSRQAARDEHLQDFFPSLPITEHRDGRADAPLQLFVYFDTDCPFCTRFHRSTLTELKRRYKDELAVSYIYFPLRSHPNAFGEALLAECAAKIGGEEYFWPAIDLLLKIALPNKLPSPADIDAFAATLELPTAPLSLCVADKTTANRIYRDIQDGILRDVSGVPTIIVAANNQQEMLATANILKLQPVIDRLYRIH